MLLATVAPDAQARADRLAFALRMLRCGLSACDTRRKVREQFGVSEPTAWRVVDMAMDMSDSE